MKRFFPLLFLITSLLPIARAQVQVPAAFVIEYAHTRFFPRAGVTAAYAMDPGIVLASAAPGGFNLTGKAPGETTVILVTEQGVRNINVTVPMPTRPGHSVDEGFGDGSGTVEFGQYGLQYNSNPNQFTNEENVTQISGDRQIHVHFINANVFPASDGPPVGFPLISYEVSHTGRSMTFLDRMVDNTDLTLSSIIVRGFHMRRGPWEFHGGITSITEFQDFILPSNRYEVAGLSRHFVLNKKSALEANLYYFNTDTTQNPLATPGGIGTLYYQHIHSEHLRYSAEVGVGTGIAFAGKLDMESKKQQFHGDFHYESPGIASLAINEVHGRTADLSWNRTFRKKFQTQAYGNETLINLRTEQQDIDTGTFNQMYWITPHVAATAGLMGSRYVSQVPVAPTVASLGYLVGPTLLWKHVGASVQFQNLHNSGNTPSSKNYQLNLQGSAGHWNASAFFDSQSQTPVFAPVQSGQADLRALLQYDSATAVTPLQMSHLLKETSALGTQGYMQPLTVGVAVKRQQYGTTIDWSNERAGHLSLNGLINTSTGGSVPDLRLTTGGIIWTRKLGVRNSINAGFSMFQTTSAGQSSTHPVIQIAIQHQLYSVPRWFVPGRRGTIEGHVFVDSNYSQQYTAGAPPLADVLIYLDGRRSTHTDKNGYFVFHGVPFGTHRVEADYKDSRPFYYTTSSPKSVSTGGSADFGICFAQGHIFGKVTTDAGSGLQATLIIEGKGFQRQVETNSDGSAEVEGLPDGVYTVQAMTSSLPPGYSLSDLEDQSVRVTANLSGHFLFKISAQRSIAGKVQGFQTSNGKSFPLAGLAITIPDLKRKSHTDAQGRFLFRHLPPGDVTISFEYDGKQYTRDVSLAAAPDIEDGVDITVPILSVAAPPPPIPAESTSGDTDPSNPRFQRHNRPRHKK